MQKDPLEYKSTNFFIFSFQYHSTVFSNFEETWFQSNLEEFMCKLPEVSKIDWTFF